MPRLEDVRSNYIEEQYALDVALIRAALGISSPSSLSSILHTIIKYSSSSRMLLLPALIQSQAIEIYSQIPIPPEPFLLSISRFLNRRIAEGRGRAIEGRVERTYDGDL